MTFEDSSLSGYPYTKRKIYTKWVVVYERKKKKKNLVKWQLPPTYFLVSANIDIWWHEKRGENSRFTNNNNHMIKHAFTYSLFLNKICLTLRLLCMKYNEMIRYIILIGGWAWTGGKLGVQWSQHKPRASLLLWPLFTYLVCKHESITDKNLPYI